MLFGLPPSRSAAGLLEGMPFRSVEGRPHRSTQQPLPSTVVACLAYAKKKQTTF